MSEQDPYRIRRAQREDIPAIQGMAVLLLHSDQQYDPTLTIPDKKLFYATKRGAAELGRVIRAAGRTSLCLVADYARGEDTPEAIGYALIRVEKDELRGLRKGEVENVFVAEEHRGKHVASRMFTDILLWQEQEEVDYLGIRYLAANQGATKFYQSQGFQPIVQEVWNLSPARPTVT